MHIAAVNLVAGYAPSPEGALLRDLSFQLTGPRLLAVVGHNGAGKTTLLRVLTGQLAPLAGTLALNGQPLPPDPASTGLLAWLPQRTDVRFSISVLDLVLQGRFRRKRWYEPWTAADHAQAAAALHQCGVAHLASRDFTTLSGGEQQLVWLAQLHTQDAPLCLLDEPTQQLDVYHRRRVFDLLASWVRQENRTVICITHDLANLTALSAACPASLLNLSPGSGPPCVVPLTPESVAAAQAELEEGCRPLARP